MCGNDQHNEQAHHTALFGFSSFRFYIMRVQSPCKYVLVVANLLRIIYIYRAIQNETVFCVNSDTAVVIVVLSCGVVYLAILPEENTQNNEFIGIGASGGGGRRAPITNNTTWCRYSS